MVRRSNRVAIVGVGYSQIGRRTGLSVEQLATQATKAALEDSGLTRSDIDGISTMGSEALGDGWAMGIEPLSWFSSSLMAPAFSYPAIQSIAAVASGMCHTALTLRVIQQQPSGAAQAAGEGRIPSAGVGGDAQFLVPVGAGNPTQWAGLMTQRYMAQYGATEEQFGAHVVTQREHAARNEDSFFRDPLTVDDYLASRYVSKPLRILDCDYPCDSGSAVIFTTEERARDLKAKPVFVEASSLSAIRDLNFEIMSDMVKTATYHCSEQLWARTDLRPEDVDTAHLYDGFSIIVFQWLEALGLCPEGEAAAFVAAGNTKLGGSLPTNTDGGACNVGRRHGANFCIEATRQLRGEAGARQVPDAKVSLWTNGVGPFGGAFLLTRD